MRYRLRTLLLLVALLPPILAVVAPPLARRLMVGPQLVRAMPGSQPDPIFKTYALQNIDAGNAQQLLSQMMPRRPVRFVPRTRALTVLASPQDHAEIQKILDGLERVLQRHYLPLIRPENADQIL